jgi:hypothetical protein
VIGLSHSAREIEGSCSRQHDQVPGTRISGIARGDGRYSASSGPQRTIFRIHVARNYRIPYRILRVSLLPYGSCLLELWDQAGHQSFKHLGFGTIGTDPSYGGREEQ